MSQAVSILANLQQSPQVQTPVELSAIGNTQSKQSLIGDGLTFEQYMARHLECATAVGSASIPGSVKSKVVDNGNILPVDGKNLPLLVTKLRQISSVDSVETNSEVVPLDQSDADLDNISSEQFAIIGMKQQVEIVPKSSGGLTNPGDNNDIKLSPELKIDQVRIDRPIGSQTAGLQTPDSQGAEIQNFEVGSVNNTIRSETLPVNTKFHSLPTIPSEARSPLSDFLARESSSSSLNLDSQNVNQADLDPDISKIARFLPQFGQGFESRGLSKRDNSTSQAIYQLNQREGSAVESLDILAGGLHLSSQTAESRPSFNYQLNLPVTNPQWSTEFSERVHWIVSSNIKKAEISLTPKNLGTIDISISLNNEQTNININTHNLQSRELIEGSLARLRDMFDQAGLGNVNVDVSQHSDQNPHSHQSHLSHNEHYQNQGDDSLVSSIDDIPTIQGKPDTLIDLYA